MSHRNKRHLCISVHFFFIFLIYALICPVLPGSSELNEMPLKDAVKNVVFEEGMVLSIENGSSEISLEYVLAGIKANDEKIKTIEAVYSVVLPEDGNRVFGPNSRWGKEGDKEYLKSIMRFRNKEDPEQFDVLDEEFYYDGHVMKTVSRNILGDGSVYVSGLIREIQQDFQVRVNPWHFLGATFTPKKMPLSKFLSQAEKVSVDKQEGGVVVLVAEDHLSKKNTEKDFFTVIKIWIDTTRGFRPIQIEFYKEKLPGKFLKFRELTNIDLKLVNDVYLPVSGVISTYSLGERILNGLTRDEFLDMPREEQAKNIECYLEPMGVSPRKMVLHEIEVNREIPPEKFAFQHKVGTVVFDEFQRIGYRVGGSSSVEEIFTEAMDNVSPARSDGGNPAVQPISNSAKLTTQSVKQD